MQAFGYTTETMQFMLLPLFNAACATRSARWATIPRWPVSVDKPRMIYDYFKQLFAQVTNPPIDSIREEVIMSLECYIGPERNLLETTHEKHAHRLRVPHPILTNEELAAIGHMHGYRCWRTKTIDITFDKSKVRRLFAALERICAEAEQAIEDGYSLIVCPIAQPSAERIPVSALAGLRRRAPSPGRACEAHPDRHRPRESARPARCSITAC